MLHEITRIARNAVAGLQAAHWRLWHWAVCRGWRLLLPIVVLLTMGFLMAVLLADTLQPVVESAVKGLHATSLLMGLGIFAGAAALLFFLGHVVGKWLKPGVTTIQEKLLHLVTLRLPPDLRQDAEASIADIMEVLKAWGQGQKVRTFGLVFTWVATFAFALAGVLFALAQIEKMQSQNQLLQSQNRIIIIEQQFQQEKDLANQRYEEIRDILLNLDSPPTAQAYALSLIPDAMRMPVAQAREKKQDDSKGAPADEKITVTTIPSYPNAPRLRSLLLTYMKLDRVGHALAKARASGELPKGADPSSEQAMSALRSLEPASSALFETLHRLGPPKSQGATANCLWNYATDTSQAGMEKPPPVAAEILPELPPADASHEQRANPPLVLHLEHVATASDVAASAPFQGFQAPFAFRVANLDAVRRAGDSRMIVWGSGTNLQSAHLEGADLEGAHLEGADLTMANLEETDLTMANLSRANLRSTTLRRAVLQRANLKAVVLIQAHLEGADLAEAHLESALLTAAHLEGAYLAGAYLQGASITEARLEGADLTEAHLESADFEKANLEEAILINARLEGSRFPGRLTSLEKADLSGAHLEGANLRRANLAGANFANARLAGADLTEADLKGANLAGAHLQAGVRRVAALPAAAFGAPSLPVYSLTEEIVESKENPCALLVPATLIVNVDLEGEFRWLTVENRFISDAEFAKAAATAGSPPDEAAGRAAAVAAQRHESGLQLFALNRRLCWPDTRATRNFLERIAGPENVRAISSTTTLGGDPSGGIIPTISASANWGEASAAVIVDGTTLEALRKLVPQEALNEPEDISKLRESLAKLQPATEAQIESRKKWSLHAAAAEALAKHKPTSRANGAEFAPPQSQSKRDATDRERQ